ncbi:MAG: uracil-xanthine permease [Lachnospiraceae bacterium]|nr:uracil-xanthine permease [Lachnospiraceae bacterium]MBR0305240.1 uracil-xanthine permease [Lachnospiraceae bacterium]
MNSTDAIYSVKELGKGKVLMLGLQHMFAMFGATVLVPILTGLDISTTLLFAGLGTLLFHLITKGKVPAFLGSSFAFLGGYGAIAPLLADGSSNIEMLPYACFGVACAGLVYVVFAGLIKVFSAQKVMSFFPPIVTGPIIIAIGLTLSKSAIDSCTDNWLLAIIAIAVVIICNIYGKGMIKIIPILLGVMASYAAGVCMGEVDFTAVKEAAWFGFPIRKEMTVFALFGENFNGETLFASILTIMPIALATIVEHVGDISAISSTTGINYIKDPGLHRTMLGDGLATVLSSVFGGPANTTYGENTGVLNLSKVYDPAVVRLAAVFAILFSFCPKVASVIQVMPTATVGGISLILYGMISAVGVRNVVENQVDFTKSRNVIIAALILVLAIGVNYSNAGAIVFHIGELTIRLSGLAAGALAGIGLNAVLPDKDFHLEVM